MRHITIGILAHVDAGKTTLSECMLYLSGQIRKLGRVDHKDAFLDTYELERERGITIFSKQAELKMGNLGITLLDTPGHVDFSAEMERALRIIDFAVKKLGVDPAKCTGNIARTGNTSAASVPILLDELVCAGQLRSGQKALCVGFGGGLTWAGALLELA